MDKTIRLVIPDWQAGNQPVYYVGAQLLEWLAPSNKNQKTINIEVPAPTGKKLQKTNGVTAQPVVEQNVAATQRVLDRESPDKIITLGGNCLVSQAPFDYLHEKYQDDLGVIWIDAHPDISNPKIFPNEHAMVLGNLLGHGDAKLSELVRAPLDPADILYVGLQRPTADEIPLMAELGLEYRLHDTGSLDFKSIQEWIDKYHFTKLAIHFDLDVLSPKLFQSQYFSEPGVTEYSAVSGKVDPTDMMGLFKELSAKNEIVGLTIAEYLPWDVVTLQKLMSSVEIFYS